MRQWSADRFRRASPVDALAVAAVVLVVLVVFLDEPHVLPRASESLNLFPTMRAPAAGAPVPRETVLGGLRGRVPPREAERQVDTAVAWGRWAELFDYDADDACFLPAGEAGRR